MNSILVILRDAVGQLLAIQILPGYALLNLFYIALFVSVVVLIVRLIRGA